MSTPLKVVYVAAAALKNEAGDVLLAQRPEGKAAAGLWEFPGGKIEVGETPEEALKREMVEELAVDIDVRDMQPLTFVSHRYEEYAFHLVMFLYGVKKWQGAPNPQENQNFKWVKEADFQSYSIIAPPADVPLFEFLDEHPF